MVSDTYYAHHPDRERMIEGQSGRGRTRQEYIVEIKGGRKYVVVKRLSSEGDKLQVHQHLSRGGKEDD